MSKDKYYSIGKTSELTNISIPTLRYYDNIGLLIPKVRKSDSKYRYYTDDQLVTAFLIRRLRILNFSLKEIKEITSKNSADTLEEFFLQKEAAIDKEIDNLVRNRQLIIHIRERIREGIEILNDPGSRQPRIEQVPQIHLFSERAVIHSYHNEDVSMDRWVNMTEQVQKRRLDMVGSFYVTYYTELLGQILENDCDVEFGVHVSEDDAQKEGVRSFGGFTAAVLNYTGDYSSIYMAYIELNRWIKKNDLYITGPSTERFVISPIDLTNKEDQVTQIIIPVSDVKPQ